MTEEGERGGGGIQEQKLTEEKKQTKRNKTKQNKTKTKELTENIF